MEKFSVKCVDNRTDRTAQGPCCFLTDQAWGLGGPASGFLGNDVTVPQPLGIRSRSKSMKSQVRSQPS